MLICQMGKFIHFIATFYSIFFTTFEIKWSSLWPVPRAEGAGCLLIMDERKPIFVNVYKK